MFVRAAASCAAWAAAAGATTQDLETIVARGVAEAARLLSEVT